MAIKRFAVVVFLLAAIALAAFGSATQEAMEEGPQEVTFYLWDDPTYAQLVDGYNASHTDIQVAAEYVPASEYETKLITLLAGGTPMDAYMQKRATDIFQQFANGYILRLDDLIDSTGFDFQPLSGYSEAVTVDGSIVALPFRGASYYTYYNKLLFDAAGEEYPTAYVERGEWTWDKFAEVARRMASDDVNGSLLYTWGSQQVMPALQDGVEFITQDGKIDLNDTVAYSLRLRKSLEEDGAMMSLTELKATQTHYSTAFFAGDLAMLVIGEWFPGQLQNARTEGLFQGFTWDDWALTRMPDNHDTYRTFGNPTFNHVHADSDIPEAAFDVISWMAGPEGAETVAKAGFMPAQVSPAAQEALRANIPDDESFRYYVEDRMVKPQFYTRYGTRIEQAIGEITEMYLLDEVSDEELPGLIRDRMAEIVETSN